MIEHHEYKCRQLSIPIQIVDLVDKQIISVKQAWLTGIIDALVECKGIGCFASFAWLANRVQVKERQVRNLIEDLVSKGILIEAVSKDGRKMLETKWSRASEVDEVSLPGRNTLQTKIAKNCETESQKIATYNNVSISSKLCDAPASHRTATDTKTSDIVDIETRQSKFPTPQSSPFAKEMTNILYEGLKKAEKIDKKPNFDEWRKCFDTLANRLYKRPSFIGKPIDAVHSYIKMMVKYHIDHLRDSFHPVLHSATSFCDPDRFIKLEDARQRRIQDEETKNKKNNSIFL